MFDHPLVKEMFANIWRCSFLWRCVSSMKIQGDNDWIPTASLGVFVEVETVREAGVTAASKWSL